MRQHVGQLGCTIPLHQVVESIEAAEVRARQRDLPRVIAGFLPAFHDLRAGYYYLFARSGLISDAVGVGSSAAWRIHTLTVNPHMHRDDIPRLRDVGGGRNGPERFGSRPSIRIVADKRNMVWSRKDADAKRAQNAMSVLIVACELSTRTMEIGCSYSNRLNLQAEGLANFRGSRDLGAANQ